jgi:homoserine O-acetyltransferase
MRIAAALLALVVAAAAGAQPAQKEGTFVVKDFRFHDGETLPELKLHYTTLGSPGAPAVLVLHGTGGSGPGMLAPGYWGPLFAAGEPLDASRYYIILPDAIGAGKSSKPSDGLRAKFPKYNYDDMVRAQHRLVTEHLGVKKLRLVIGNSMGGMHTWMWATMYPEAMSAAVPLASLPTEVAGRNWLTRRMLIDLIRNDPEYNNGNYAKQPRGLQLAQIYFAFATSGGNQGLHKLAPTNAAADALMDKRMAEPVRGDANDYMFQFASSQGYNPSLHLEKIQATLWAINSADDERNPPELGIMEREIKRVRKGRYIVVPGSEDTRGHGTTAMARLWKHHLVELLRTD